MSDIRDISPASGAKNQIKNQTKNQAMPKITFIEHDDTVHTVEAELGSTVMEAAMKGGVTSIVAECGGACSCATCLVHVDEKWFPMVGPPSEQEEDMLDFAYEVKPTSRLSCQIKVTEALDGLIVRTPSYQGR
jgi:2Fe-2S ferredoxin